MSHILSRLLSCKAAVDLGSGECGRVCPSGQKVPAVNIVACDECSLKMISKEQ